MAAAILVPCPVCGRGLQQPGDEKRCPECKLKVKAEVELRVNRLTDRSLMKLYGDQVLLLGIWRPRTKQKQLYGFSDGKWYITLSWPNHEPERFREASGTWGKTKDWGLADGQNLGPKVVWRKGFTFCKDRRKGMRAHIPKICGIRPGQYLASLVLQDDYVYLVFLVEQATSTQNT